MKQLISDEKESLVMPNRSAKRSTKLAAIKPRDITTASSYRSRRTVWQVEEVLGVQMSIAEKLESFTVKLVRSTFEHNIDLRSTTSPKLGGISARLDFKLLDRVGHREYAVLVDY